MSTVFVTKDEEKQGKIGWGQASALTGWELGAKGTPNALVIFMMVSKRGFDPGVSAL